MNLPRSRTRWGMCIVAVAVLGGALILLTSSPQGQAAADEGAAPKYELTAPLDVIMEHADTIFYEMEDKLKKNKFKTLKREAQFVAELANLSAFSKDHLKEAKYQEYCKKMKADLLSLAEAAEKKDAAGFKKLHTAAEETCDSCHEDFRD